MQVGSRALLTLSLVPVLACADPPTGFTGDEGVLVRGVAGAARIVNERGRPIFYFLVERHDAAVIDWAPCTSDVDACPHVESGQTLVIPYLAIAGYDRGDDQAILFWWQLAPDPRGELRVDRVRSQVFDL